MFGGQSLTLAVTATTNNYKGEVWSTMSPSTTPTSEFPTGIAGLKQHEIVYDPLKQRAIMFGGITGQDYGPNTNAVYVYKGDFATGDWNLEIAEGTGGMPAKRHNFAMSVDPDRNELVIFGGRTAGNAQDTWVVDLTDDPLTVGSFTEKFPSTKPFNRQMHRMWYNPINKLHYLFGGNGNGGGLFHHLWTYNAATNVWTDITPTGGDQIDVTYNWDTADVMYIPTRRTAIMAGRVPQGAGDKAQVWELTHNPPATAVWTLVLDDPDPDPAPPARKFQSGHWDPDTEYFYYSMGDNGFIGNPEEDTWRLNVPASLFAVIGSIDEAATRIIAKDTLRVMFSIDVAVNDDLINLNNWTLTPVTGGAIDPEIKQVMFDPTFDSVQFVDLEITRTTLGATYQVTVDGLKNVTGNPLADIEDNTVLSAEFVSHLTKVDSILTSVPGMYGTGLNSNLRHVLAAVGIQDEEIGGE
jgi:hypothetical protein